jgi:hypothetical protein
LMKKTINCINIEVGFDMEVSIGATTSRWGFLDEFLRYGFDGVRYHMLIHNGDDSSHLDGNNICSSQSYKRFSSSQIAIRQFGRQFCELSYDLCKRSSWINLWHWETSRFLSSRNPFMSSC